MGVNQPLDSWEVARASAKPQASWEHLRDETRSEMRQSGAVSGFSLSAGDAPCAPSDEVFFLFCGSGGVQSHSIAAVQETWDETTLPKHILSTSRSVGAQQLGFNMPPYSFSCIKTTLKLSQTEKAPHKLMKNFLLLSWSCPH